MELKVEKLVTTEKMGGEIEEKAILKGEDGADSYTLTIVGAKLQDAYVLGDPFKLELVPIQTKLTGK